MSYYVWGSGISYSQYLQAKSFIDDVSSASKQVSLEVSRQTRELIASNEVLARGNIRVGDAVAEGFDRLSYNLEAISAELSELNATFHWGFSQVIAQLGHMNDALSELVKIAKTPVQTTAYNHFEIARDAFRQSLYQECLEELNKAINGDHTSPGYRLDWRFHQMVGTLHLGFADGDLSLVDLKQAEESFLLAARYARADYLREAAVSFLSAGWAVYCQGRMKEAIAHTEEAINLAPEMGEALFQEAKVLMANAEADRAIAFLRRSVYIDRDYLLKAAGDGDFQNHNEELLELIGELTQEAMAEAERAIASAQLTVNEMEKWHTSEGASSQSESALALLAEAQETLRSGSYFGYLDARSLVGEFQEKAQQALKTQEDYLLKMTEVLRNQVVQLKKDYVSANYYTRGRYSVWINAQMHHKIDLNDLNASKPYAPRELELFKSALRNEEEVRSLFNSKAVTYARCKQVQSSLQKCIRLGLSAVEKSLEAQEEEELGTLKSAAKLLLLWPLLITVGISHITWDWRKAEPIPKFDEATHAENFWLCTIFAPFFWFYIFRYSNNKKKVRERYLTVKASFKEKYSPILSWKI